MVEPVSNTTVPNLVADKVTSVEHRQAVENTVNDRDVSKSREDAESKKDKEREERRLAALGDLHEEIMKQSGVDDGHLRIREDEISGRTIYETVDNESGEVLKQFPAEEILRSVRYLKMVSGMMVDRRA